MNLYGELPTTGLASSMSMCQDHVGENCFRIALVTGPAISETLNWALDAMPVGEFEIQIKAGVGISL